jgi:RNA polymerase sigma-70 factor (ECF subfamily)
MPEDDAPTRPSLLVRIRDAADHEAWCQFVAIYAPLVYRFVSRRGLQDADAADLTQEVFRAVARAAGRLEYVPRRGSFRGWLFTIVRNKLYDFRLQRKHETAGSGHSAVHDLIEEQSAPEDNAECWEQEYQQRLFQCAVEQVKDDFEPSTWQAFWKTAIEGKRGKEAAAELGLSIAAVYLAKSRVTARIKKEIGRLQDQES